MKHTRDILLVLLLTLVNCQFSFADNNTKIVKNTKHKSNGEYVRERFITLMKKPFTNKTHPLQKKILIIGDSHAQDFLNAITENNYLDKDQIKTRYIPTRCQIVLVSNFQRYWLNDDKKLCERSDILELAKDQIIEAEIIILAAFWRKWAAEKLPETIKNIQLKPEQRLFVIGRRSFRKVNENETQNLTKIELKQLRNEVDENQIEINNIMQDTLDKNIFINVHEIVCGKGSTCPAFTDDVKLISFDGGHLSKEGARYIGRIIFQQSQLKSLL